MKLIIFSLMFLVSACSGQDVIPTKDCLTKALKEVPELLVSLNDLLCKYFHAKDNNELYNQVYKELKDLLEQAGCALVIGAEAGTEIADLANNLIEDVIRKLLDNLPITEDLFRLLCDVTDGLTKCITNANLLSTDTSAVIALLKDPSNTVDKIFDLVDSLGKTFGCTLTDLLSKDKLNQLTADAQKLVAGLLKVDVLKTLDVNGAIDDLLGKGDLLNSLMSSLGDLLKNVLAALTGILSGLG
ncbi:uncharacterized protein LOC128662962 [Bombina bombina]|uniref:uncharacterized protein LOC128662962 n=1 Tax=Bombina bombina TaxID=8345 RepID=UPI00235A882F|nr:uncharacterized protein LOC128662962 [Bombina bombina]